MEEDRSQNVLMSTFGFTTEELIANRRGYMTFEQRAKLKHRSRKRVAQYVLITGLIAIIFIYAIGGLALGGGTNEVQAIPLIACLGVYLIVAAVGSAIAARRVRADLYKGMVFSVVGERVESMVVGGRQRMIRPALYSPPINLDVPPGAVLAFEKGKMYRIYFALYSKTVLSAECITDA